MLEPMLVGAAIFAAGALADRFVPARRRGLRSRKSPEPICGCKHHHSYHDPKTGECHCQMYVPGTAARLSHHTPCTCRQYSGPVPLPEYMAQEIAGGDS